MSNWLILATSGAPERPLRSTASSPSLTDARMKKLSRLYFVGLVICLPLVAGGQEKQRFANMDEAMQAGAILTGRQGPRNVNWIEGDRKSVV